MRFFRPWNKSSNINADKISIIQDQMNTQIHVKCDHEDCSGSVILSVLSNNGNNCSESVIRSASLQETSVCSYLINCEDLIEKNNLSALSNFVYNTRPELLSINDSVKIYSTYRTECPQSSIQYSFQSAFTPVYKFPWYSFEHHIPLHAGFVPVDESSYFKEFNPQTVFYELHNFRYDSQCSVEDTIKHICQQDMLDKQIKKFRQKKFRCKYCDIAFSNNGQLTGHTRIHTGERPFKCNVEGCSKSFTRNEELTRHKRIHTGSRPYSCIICGKQFGRKDHLRKHSRTHDNRSSYYISAIAPGLFTSKRLISHMYPV